MINRPKRSRNWRLAHRKLASIRCQCSLTAHFTTDFIQTHSNISLTLLDIFRHLVSASKYSYLIFKNWKYFKSHELQVKCYPFMKFFYTSSAGNANTVFSADITHFKSKQCFKCGKGFTHSMVTWIVYKCWLNSDSPKAHFKYLKHF